MVFSGIAADDQDSIRIPDVDPVIGHCTAAKRGSQTGHRSRVSYARLVLYVSYSQSTHKLAVQVALFIVKRRTAQCCDCINAVVLAAIGKTLIP